MIPSTVPTAYPTSDPILSADPEVACDDMVIEQEIEARVTNLLQTSESSLITLSSICEEAFRITAVSLSAEVVAWPSEWCLTADVRVRVLDDDAFLITVVFSYGEALDADISKHTKSEVSDEFRAWLASLMVSDGFITSNEDIEDVVVKDAVNSETAVVSDGLATSLTSGDTLSQLGWIIVTFAAVVVLLIFASFWLILRNCGAKQAKKDIEMLGVISADVNSGKTPATSEGGGQTEVDVV